MKFRTYWKGNISASYLNCSVCSTSRMAPHVARVAAAGAAFHLHAGRPNNKVRRSGIHLAPRDFVNYSANFARCGQGFFHFCRRDQMYKKLQHAIRRFFLHQVSVYLVKKLGGGGYCAKSTF